MKNIILIGMPSSGKTTIGRLVAEKTNMLFIDTDEFVVCAEKKTIPEIFELGGEKLFREKEKIAVNKAVTFCNAVIACGGGVVLDNENMQALKKNGFVVFLKRDITFLSSEGRPLSKDLNAIKNIEKTRLPLYNQYADFSVDNAGSTEEIAEKIVRGFYENNDN